VSSNGYRRRSSLPGTDRPLSQLKIVIEQPRSLLAELGELIVAPDGQLLLRFDTGDGEKSARPVPLSADPASSTADEWFEHGRLLEDQGRLMRTVQRWRCGRSSLRRSSTSATCCADSRGGLSGA
jgi:hypothetical protein